MTLMMTVSGVRGVVGETMTPTLAAELGLTFGTHLAMNPAALRSGASGGGTGDSSIMVVVGRDSRPSGPMVQAALTSGLLAAGCNVIDLGVVSTPSVAVMVLERGAAGGVVVTASHNPINWNGIKFLTAGGYAPPADEAAAILDRYRARNWALADVDHLGRVERDQNTCERHVQRVIRLLDVDAIRRRALTVVLDSVNGAGAAAGRLLLERLGCRVVAMNAEPTGRFAHPPEPTEDNLASLVEAVRQHGADLGFAQDPDADRLAIVDDRGRYIGEECTVALAAKCVFATRPGPAAVNLSTSRMIDDLARQAGRGCIVHRTPVGEANVAQAMRRDNCVIGGEGNGGVIEPSVSFVRDSLVAMGLLLNLLASEKRASSAIAAELPQYVMLKRKFELDRSRIDQWLKRVPQIAGNGRLNDADGIRIDWPEGWAHVRASNTEPIARVIAEAADRATTEALIARVTDLL